MIRRNTAVSAEINARGVLHDADVGRHEDVVDALTGGWILEPGERVVGAVVTVLGALFGVGQFGAAVRNQCLVGRRIRLAVEVAGEDNWIVCSAQRRQSLGQQRCALDAGALAFVVEVRVRVDELPAGRSITELAPRSDPGKRGVPADAADVVR